LLPSAASSSLIVTAEAGDEGGVAKLRLVAQAQACPTPSLRRMQSSALVIVGN
jgi:hypothetical protein